MNTLTERKAALCSIIDNYRGWLDRQNGEDYRKRGQYLASRREDIEREFYEIALVGYAKRGKSTIINALLGDQNNPVISPANYRTCTGAVVYYRDSKLHPHIKGKEEAIIHFNTGQTELSVSMDDALKFIDQTNKEFDPEKAKEIDYIEIYGSFPLMETRGVLIDTPGLGAMYDQDNLANNILLRADVILCPLAANNFLVRDEQVFYKNLPKAQKKKLVFILTKIDQEGELLPEAEFEKLRDIMGGEPPLFKVAAKMVVDANKAKKSPEEVEEIKKDSKCGIKKLEDHIDKKLREFSRVESIIKSLCVELEGQLGNDKTYSAEAKENVKLDYNELLRKRETSGEEYKILEEKFNKGIKKLKREWEKTVKYFITELEAKESTIVNELLQDKGKGLSDLIHYKKRLERNIYTKLESVLKPELMELQIKLGECISTFAKELIDEIEDSIDFNNSYFSRSGLKHEISTWAGGIALLGTGVGGAALAVGSAQAIATTGAVLAGTIAEVGSYGLFAKIGAGLFGSSLGAAQATFFAALIGGAVAIPVGLGLGYLAIKAGNAFIDNKVSGMIPDHVRQKRKEAVVNIESACGKLLEYVLGEFEEHWKNNLEKSRAELDSCIEDIKNHKTENRLLEIERNIKELDSISFDLTNLINRLNIRGNY